MSGWIEENNDHILEGHGDKFVVGHVLCTKQIPPKWKIKQSPFLLDVHKRFATLGEAKEYCERRYQELFGHDDEITRLRAENSKSKSLIGELLDYAESLEGRLDGHDLGMLEDTDLKSRARAALEGVTEPATLWRDIESAPKNGRSIEVWDKRPGAVNPTVVFWENDVWVYSNLLLAEFAPDGALPSHWRQRSGPPR